MKEEDLNNLSKAELEALKLREEIKSLGLSWWKKPSYLGAVIPAVLTLVTILTGIITGFIDLKKQKIGYDSQLEEMSKTFQTYRDSIEQKIVGIDYELQQKISENLRLSGNIDSLKITYSETLEDYKKRTESLSKEARNKEYLTHINAILSKKNTVWPLHNSSRALIELLTSNHRKIVKELIENALLGIDDHLLEGNFYYILYKGTKEQQYLDKILRIIDVHGADIDFHFWHIFSTGDWNCPESMRIAEKMILSIKKWQYKNHGASQLGSIDDLVGCDNLLSNFSSTSLYFDGIILSRKLALDKETEWFYRNDGLLALAAFEPSAFITVCSEIIVNEQDNPQMLSQVENSMSQLNYKIDDELRDLNTPSTTNLELWKQWRSENADYISNWINDKDLTKYRENPSLLN